MSWMLLSNIQLDLKRYEAFFDTSRNKKQSTVSFEAVSLFMYPDFAVDVAIDTLAIDTGVS